MYRRSSIDVMRRRGTSSQRNSGHDSHAHSKHIFDVQFLDKYVAGLAPFQYGPGSEVLRDESAIETRSWWYILRHLDCFLHDGRRSMWHGC